jgi:hypothetical protein
LNGLLNCHATARKNSLLETILQARKPSIVKLLSFPEKRLGQPNRETATAQHCRPAYVGGRRKTASLRGLPGSPPAAFISFTATPRFEGVYIRYGMATVLPYVGPVKRLSLYIVSQAINGADARVRHGFSTVPRRQLARGASLRRRRGVCCPVVRLCHRGQQRTRSGIQERIGALKQTFRPDAQDPIGVDQIVALLAALLPAERVHKCERFGELFCLDQELAAVDLPRAICLVHFRSPVSEGICRFQLSNWLESSWRRGRIYAPEETRSIP